MRQFIRLFEEPQQYYLRLGKPPLDGRSEIGAAPNWIKAIMQRDSHETGVSVYPVHWNEQRHRWSIECNNLASLDELFAQKRPAYLGTGEPVMDQDGYDAFGMDDEPLLRDVKIVRELQYRDLYVCPVGATIRCRKII